MRDLERHRAAIDPATSTPIDWHEQIDERKLAAALEATGEAPAKLCWCTFQPVGAKLNRPANGTTKRSANARRGRTRPPAEPVADAALYGCPQIPMSQRQTSMWSEGVSFVLSAHQTFLWFW